MKGCKLSWLRKFRDCIGVQEKAADAYKGVGMRLESNCKGSL